VHFVISWLHCHLDDLSLRKTIASALIVGLVVPVGVSAWTYLTDARATLMNQLENDHARIVDVLAHGLEMPIWDIRPDAGQPLLDALMLDERVTAITVSSPLLGNFLETKAPDRHHGKTLYRRALVWHEGEVIGEIEVYMDTGPLEARLAVQWTHIVAISLLQLLTGMVIIFALLRFKVLAPLQRLVRESDALGGGECDRPLEWQRGDELGVLGRSFDKMRRSLRRLIGDLEQHNRELQDKEAKLASQASLLRATLENMTDGITLVDAKLQMVTWNERFVDITGIPRHLVRPAVHIDRLMKSHIVPYPCGSGGETRVLETMGERIRLGRAHACESRTAAGRWIDTRWRAMPAGGFVITYTDISERKRAEAEIMRQREALHQSEKLNALGSLLAGVAHELNNPLSVVVGRAIMMEEQDSCPEVAANAKKIRLATERCARIVKTFLAIARQQPPARSAVQINAVIQSAVDLLAYGLRTADIETRLDLAPNLPDLSADADQLTQVLSNLILNARHTLLEAPNPRRLEITSRLDLEGDTVRVEVTDNGPGVPAAVRSRIFEPYYTSKPVGEGTGIGLSFSYGVIESHDGKLTLETPRRGGARFVITLPIVSTEAPAPRKADRQTSLTTPHRILIVDDEREIGEMLGDILSGEGHHIDIAASGNEALQRLAQSDYDLILSDLMMPDLDGQGLYARLRNSHPRLVNRIVFITGDTLGSAASQFLAETGRPVIEKPFIPAEVIRLLNRELKQK
jgi:two-component system NtrC family sensor kinase